MPLVDQIEDSDRDPQLSRQFTDIEPTPRRRRGGLKFIVAAFALLACGGAYYMLSGKAQGGAPMRLPLPELASADTAPARPVSGFPPVQQIQATTDLNALPPTSAGPASAPAKQELFNEVGGLNTKVATVLDQQREQMASLSRIEALLQEKAAAPAAEAPARKTVVTPPRKRAAPKAVAKRSDTTSESHVSLFSVDMWDGRPSVAIKSTNPSDKRVVFAAEGDQHAGISLKRADLSSQQAVFDVNGRAITLQRDKN